MSNLGIVGLLVLLVLRPRLRLALRLVRPRFASSGRLDVDYDRVLPVLLIEEALDTARLSVLLIEA